MVERNKKKQNTHLTSPMFTSFIGIEVKRMIRRKIDVEA